MLTRGYVISFKILLYLSLAFFILFKGSAYFHLSSGFRKILVAMLFLFAILRIFEGFQLYKARQNGERKKY